MNRSTLAILAIAALLALGPLAAHAATNHYYLGGGSTPVSSLSPSPGAFHQRFLQKSGEGYAESDTTKYQILRGPADGIHIVGSPALTIWVKMKDDNQVKTGRFETFLMDCVGSSCTKIDGELEELIPGGPWKETTIQFDGVDHVLGRGHDIAIKIVVENESDDDMWFAWGGPYPSLLFVASAAATTTSSTTTTTTVPSATTTTAAPDTSTTGPATSGTSQPGSAATTPPDPTEDGGALVAASSTTTIATTPIVQFVGLDTDKSSLVVRTTPAQRGVTVAASSLKLSPLEGLMVSFESAVEAIQAQFANAAILGLLMATLLILGLSRRAEDEELDD